MLNRFDEILEEAAVQKKDTPSQDETGPSQTDCIFLCPKLNDSEVSYVCTCHNTVLVYLRDKHVPINICT